MNFERFKQAKEAYDRGDFRAAARGFLESVEPGTPIANGAAYHMAGNALMKLKRYSDAVTAYREALRDDSYLKQGGVEANLAQAELQLGNLNSALAHYEAALREPDYEHPYRCYMGIGALMMRKEEYTNAAIAYRRAAIDESNPEPGRALVNLGISLMAIDRPKDAIEAYKAALNVDSYRNKGLVLSNLGLAYAAYGEHKSAIMAFEEALELHDYSLSPQAKAQLKASRRDLSEEELYKSADLRTLAADLAGQPTGTFGDVSRKEAAEAELAGEQAAETTFAQEELELTTEAEEAQAEAAPAPVEAEVFTEEAEQLVDAEPLVTEVEAAPAPEVRESELAAFATAVASEESLKDLVSEEVEPRAPIAGVKVGTAEEVEEFFSRSDSEMRKISLEKKRKERNPLKWLKGIGIVIIVLALLAAGVYYALIQGFGYPSAEQVVEANLEAYNSGKPFESYWVEGAQAIEQMSLVPIPSAYEVGARESDYLHASLIAEMTPEASEPVQFEFRLERDLISWKIVSVSVYQP